MGTLIIYELEKIWRRKLVWAGMGILLFFSVLLSLTQGPFYVTARDGRDLHGEEARLYREERTKLYAGLLDEEKKNAILETEKYQGEMQQEYNVPLPLYSSMEWIFGEGGSFEGMTVDEAYTSRGIDVEIADIRNWSTLFNLASSLHWLLGIVVAVAVSGVFSEEYTRRTDALILTSKYGKSRCAWAKAAAAALFALGSYILLLLSYTLPFLLQNGLAGMEGGIQLDCYNGLERVPYTLNCGQAAGLLAAGGLMGTIMTAALTLLVSVWSKSAFVAVVVSCSLYLLPLIFSNGLSQTLIALSAAGAGTVIALCEDSVLGLPFYAWIAAATLAWAAAAWFLTKRSFALHQVR